jgi:predicted metal-dependent hydrolase
MIQIKVAGLDVQVVRKDIKNLHLGVYPPSGRVRVAVPLAVSDHAVRIAIIQKLGWIKRQQAGFKSQQRQSEREMVAGESHYFMGKRYRLRILEHDGPAGVLLRNKSTLELQVRPGSDVRRRETILMEWYRKRLKIQIPPIIEKWEPVIGVSVKDWGVKKMKTKWGSCSVKRLRIWLNLELAKKPVECLEYIVFHEMVHLIEPRHSDRFRELMDQNMPKWRSIKSILNHEPLAFEKWGY